MDIASNASLVDALRQYRLLESVQVEEAARLQSAHPDPKALAGELIQRKWLTPYQANQLLQGRGQDLLLGSYVLLEKLGEGGMGAVFKARNWKLGRVVALKLIRKERLENADAVRRFEREVRAAAALSHPNIVHAYDADQIGGTHLLVMECIEGATDLAKLVKKQGPLPVAQACEYIRQAALGLQHAFERGMVHRDIKPANLLLTADGKRVKILDMGLARLDQSSADGEASSTMTQEGAVMGTPDYIAPEQAMESHTVDVRADVYSLGCTFYYLLTGKVPFPGGSLMEKLLKHQLDEPRPVEQLRPDLPPGVARVVRKLMAKKPEDRYQRPAEAATALASAVSPGSGLADGNDGTMAERPPAVREADVSGATLQSALAYMAQGGDAEALDSARRQRKAMARRWLVGVGGGAFSVGLAIALLLVFKGPGGERPQDQRVVVPPPPNPLKQGEDAWPKLDFAATPPEKQVRAVVAKLKECNPDFDGKVTHKIEDGVVTELAFETDKVTDISPVRALTGLRRLKCSGTWSKYGKKKAPLANLSPLKDMKLTYLNCSMTAVSDLSPLKGMNLTTLHCGGTKVADLVLLKGMKLTEFQCWSTQVSDLSPLKNMKLIKLVCHGTKATDLSLLKGMPLKELWCDFKPERDAEILLSIKTLETINGKPVKEFWEEVDARQAAFGAWCKEVAALGPWKQVGWVAAKLKERNPGFDGTVKEKIEGGVVTEVQFLTDKVTDIAPVRALTGLRKLSCHGGDKRKGQLADLSPLKGMTLTDLSIYSTEASDLSPLKAMKLNFLNCDDTAVSDLSPLKDMKLTELHCAYTAVSDLSPLKDMKLTTLHCAGTKVTDLSPLKHVPLTSLWFHHTKVADLSPLTGMKLTILHCGYTKVADLSPLRGMPLTRLGCDFQPERDAEILRSIKTLEKINDKPAKEVLKKVDARKAEKKP